MVLSAAVGVAVVAGVLVLVGIENAKDDDLAIVGDTDLVDSTAHLRGGP
jgi:hypothetical protein